MATRNDMNDMNERGGVLTISLNPSLDKTHVVSGFRVDDIQTARKTFAVAGGKANNVARVLRTLGHSVQATGFVGGPAGQWVAQELSAAGIETEFIDVPGHTRTRIAIVDEQQGTTTELREQGPNIPGSAQEELLERLPVLAARCRVAVVSGGLPPGVSVQFMARVVLTFVMMRWYIWHNK